MTRNTASAHTQARHKAIKKILTFNVNFSKFSAIFSLLYSSFARYIFKVKYNITIITHKLKFYLKHEKILDFHKISAVYSQI